MSEQDCRQRQWGKPCQEVAALQVEVERLKECEITLVERYSKEGDKAFLAPFLAVARAAEALLADGTTSYTDRLQWLRDALAHPAIQGR